MSMALLDYNLSLLTLTLSVCFPVTQRSLTSNVA